jgi:glycosyltransferase involved in cell wall biosynthesis
MRLRRRSLPPVPPPEGRAPAPGVLRLTVVVPAYREDDRIAATVLRLRDALAPIAASGGYEVIVVDDGSGDGTAEAARAAGANDVVVLPTNQGKGAAVRRGMAAAKGRARAYIDADLAYSPDQLLRLVDGVESGYDMVVGSRRHLDTVTLIRARRLREVSGRAFALLSGLLLLGNHRDTQCGLKAFRSDAAELLFSRSLVDGFAFDVELFLLAERYRLHVLEIPVTVTNSTESTVRVVGHGIRMLRDLLRIRRLARTGAYDLEAGPGRGGAPRRRTPTR